MSVTYEYPNKETTPNLSNIHVDIGTSAMTDKNIDFCRWDQDTEILQVVWDDALDAGDKTILDAIVVTNS